MNVDQKILERYGRAKSILGGVFTKKVAINTRLAPTWIGNTNCCWYLRQFKGGYEYRVVNGENKTNTIAFDHQVLASSLSEQAREEVDFSNLPLSECEFFLEPFAIEFTAFNKRWRFDNECGLCSEMVFPPTKNEVISPDGKRLVFKKGNDLWLRELSTGVERALTHDGEDDFSYGCSGMVWAHTMGSGLQVRWSPNGKRLFVVQRDSRFVKELPIVHHVPKDNSLRPQVRLHKMAYPGDDHVETLKLSCIDIEKNSQQAAAYTQITTTRNSHGLFDGDLAWWNKDSRLAYFVDVDRYHKYVRVMEFDTETGLVQLVFEETSDTQINMALNSDERPSLMPLPETNELLWYSERSGWAHFYLYDIEKRILKNPVTSGDWVVRNLVRFDASCRELFLQTAGRIRGRDPYYRDLVRVNIDTGELVEVISSDREYSALTRKDQFVSGLAVLLGFSKETNAVSPSGDYVVVTGSRVDEVPVSVLLDREGRELLTLETAEVHGLPSGWQWPEPVELVAADGETPIYGVVYRPSDFDSNQSYPVVSHVFSTPELTWVPKGSFANYLVGDLPYLDAMALAELGFIVVQIDGRGTPFRSKAFFDESYGDAEMVSRLDDHIAGIKQLAERYPYMDINRVGITSHITGGNGPVQALLQFPNFYKVGVAGCLHDSRLMSASMWGDKYEGKLPAADKQYPEDLAENLQGKLLLVCQMLDTTSPVTMTFRLIEALQKANKDVDVLISPMLGHQGSKYRVRRAWDYLVTHLQGLQTPKGFDLEG